MYRLAARAVTDYSDCGSGLTCLYVSPPAVLSLTAVKFTPMREGGKPHRRLSWLAAPRKYTTLRYYYYIIWSLSYNVITVGTGHTMLCYNVIEQCLRFQVRKKVGNTLHQHYLYLYFRICKCCFNLILNYMFRIILLSIREKNLIHLIILFGWLKYTNYTFLWNLLSMV